jgi:hypothetical protein
VYHTKIKELKGEIAMKLFDNARKSVNAGLEEEEWRKADKEFVFTRSGKRVYFLSIDEKQFNVLDFCYGLARNFRWNGATRIPWSVAQHSLLVSKMLGEMKWNTPLKDMRNVKLKGLTHDFTEALLGDVATPIKRELSLYTTIEDNLERNVEHFLDLDEDVDNEIRRLVKRADTLCLIYEALTIVEIDDKYREYCLSELEKNYADVKGMELYEVYKKEIRVENPDYVSGKLLKELYSQCKEARKNLNCFENISDKYLTEEGMVPIFVDGELKYRVYTFGKSISVKDENTRVSYNLSKALFDNMLDINNVYEALKGI